MTEQITRIPGGFQITFDAGEVVRIAGNLSDLETFLEFLDHVPPERRAAVIEAAGEPIEA